MPATQFWHERGLWLLTAGPAIWAVHFLASYVGAAVYCAKWATATAALDPIQRYVAVLTAMALLGILGLGWNAYRRWYHAGDPEPPHDAATLADRRRFLGFAALLLCGLSFVATIYTALAALLAASCR
ncbi:hypothetical protein [Benzoatithermus flavus]|uniref:Transmembrane prediction n=1 Tax=Benzoatithermus flavus TaxID=3108223 RepID=A0ABU8XWV6_9PROT